MTIPSYGDLDDRPSRLPDALTVEEAASLLRISTRTARRRIAEWESGNTRAWPTHVIRLGRIVRIPLHELQAVLGVSPAA